MFNSLSLKYDKFNESGNFLL